MKNKAFISIWMSNSLIFFLVYLIWPKVLVLGNNLFPPLLAALLAGFLLALIRLLIEPLIKIFDLDIPKQRYIFVYLVLNILGIWVIARLAKITGIGIISYWVSIALGLLLTYLHWFILKVGIKKSK